MWQRSRRSTIWPETAGGRAGPNGRVSGSRGPRPGRPKSGGRGFRRRHLGVAWGCGEWPKYEIRLQVLPARRTTVPDGRGDVGRCAGRHTGQSRWHGRIQPHRNRRGKLWAWVVALPVPALRARAAAPPVARPAWIILRCPRWAPDRPAPVHTAASGTMPSRAPCLWGPRGAVPARRRAARPPRPARRSTMSVSRPVLAFWPASSPSGRPARPSPVRTRNAWWPRLGAPPCVSAPRHIAGCCKVRVPGGGAARIIRRPDQDGRFPAGPSCRRRNGRKSAAKRATCPRILSLRASWIRRKFYGVFWDF